MTYKKVWIDNWNVRGLKVDEEEVDLGGGNAEEVYWSILTIAQSVDDPRSKEVERIKNALFHDLAEKIRGERGEQEKERSDKEVIKEARRLDREEADRAYIAHLRTILKVVETGRQWPTDKEIEEWGTRGEAGAAWFIARVAALLRKGEDAWIEKECFDQVIGWGTLKALCAPLELTVVDDGECVTITSR